MKSVSVKIIEPTESSTRKFVEFSGECNYLNRIWGLLDFNKKGEAQAVAQRKEILGKNDDAKVLRLCVGIRHGKYKSLYTSIRKLHLEIKRNNNKFNSKKTGDRTWVHIENLPSMTKKDIVRLSRTMDETGYMICLLDRKVKKKKNEMIEEVRLMEGAIDIISDIILED